MNRPSRLQFDDENDDVSQDTMKAAEQDAETAARIAGTPQKRYPVRREQQPASNPISRWQQRRAIRKQYADAKAGRNVKTTKQAAEATGKAAETVRAAAKKSAEIVRRHKKGFLIVGAAGLVLAFFLNVFSSCSVIVEGIGSAFAGSTYPSEDTAMLGAEEAYCAMEAELQEYLDSYESTHDYDEYHYDLDSIGHDPYVLISILTAWHQGAWTLNEVRETLQMLLEKQYILTEHVTSETRYETETRTDEHGNEIEVEVPYTYYICKVKLDNFNLSHVPVYIMGEDRLSLYAAYMGTLGNRGDLFPSSPYIARYANSYTDYDIPPEVLADEQFKAIITEAEKYLGYPYVWGGSSPSTSFDCSGFVSWVINHSGWNVGRLSADGLYHICIPVSSANARPGDLLFFEGTYDTPGMSHVGIYVGNNTMIHCGDPISYTNLNSSYWQAHIAAFGRLP